MRKKMIMMTMRQDMMKGFPENIAVQSFIEEKLEDVNFATKLSWRRRT
jgi:hypothetical protein